MDNFLVVRKSDGVVVNITVGIPPVNVERLAIYQHVDQSIMIGSTVEIVDGLPVLKVTEPVFIEDAPAAVGAPENAL